MGFTNTYKTLFEVKVLHHYFLNKGNDIFGALQPADQLLVLKNYDVREFISFEPTPECSKTLSKYRLICKATPAGLIVGVQAKRNGNNFEPFVPLENDLRFTFLLRFVDPLFSNYSSLPLNTVIGSSYYFQNRKANSAKKFPFLSRFAAQFTASQKYSAGEILSDNANAPTQIFVASSIKGTAPPGAGWIADPLVGGQPLHYVTGNDLLPVYFDLLRFNTGETDLNPTVTIKDRGGNIFNLSFEKLNDNNATVVLADIHVRPEDFFTIKIEDTAKPFTKEFSFYHLLQNTNADAILDLSIKSDDAAYDMVNSSGFLLSPVYELRFRNRSLAWQYNGEKFTAKPKTPPNPLTKFGFIPVTLKDDANKDVDLPNPNIRMIQVEQPANDKQHYNLFTETYIH